MISFSDYMMNQTAGGVGPTQSQLAAYQQQYQQDANREQNNQGIQDWEQSRNPYYASLYNQQVNAGNAQAQQQYNDSLKRLQLQHIARGTNGGSQELYNQSQLGSHYQQMAAQNAQQAQNYVQGIRGQDQNQASQMRMQQYGEDPLMAGYYDSLRRSNNFAGQSYGNDISNQMANAGINQNYKNQMSQVYGQAIKQGAEGAQSYFGGGM